MLWEDMNIVNLLQIVAYVYVTVVMPRKARPVKLTRREGNSIMEFAGQKQVRAPEFASLEVKLPRSLKDKVELDSPLLPLSLNLTFRMYNHLLPVPFI